MCLKVFVTDYIKNARNCKIIVIIRIYPSLSFLTLIFLFLSSLKCLGFVEILTAKNVVVAVVKMEKSYEKCVLIQRLTIQLCFI